MATAGANGALASSLTDEVESDINDLQAIVTDPTPKVLTQMRSVRVPATSIAEEIDNERADFATMVKELEVIDGLERVAVSRGFVSGDYIDEKRKLAAKIKPPPQQQQQPVGIVLPCVGECKHRDGGKCTDACIHWRTQWSGCMDVITKAEAFHSKTMAKLMQNDVRIAMETSGHIPVAELFRNLFAASDKINAKSILGSEYSIGVLNEQDAFVKRVYSELCDEMAPVFFDSRNVVQSQLRPVKIVALDIGRLGNVLLQSMGKEKWIASNAKTMAKHIAQLPSDEWADHARTMDHTGEMLISAAQTMFRLAADAANLAKHLRKQAEDIESGLPQLPGPSATKSNVHWRHHVPSKSASLADLDIWGNVTFGTCHQGACKCANGAGGVGVECCQNCCPNCTNLDAWRTKFQTCLRALLNMQPSGNLVAYTGAAFFRDCFRHLQGRLRDDATWASRISQGFHSLGEALTHQHFIVLSGTYLMRVLNTPPSTQPIVKSMNQTVTPIDILQVLFGPQFVSDIDDGIRKQLRIEIPSRGHAWVNKVRVYLATKYIPAHMTSIQKVARTVFDAELDTLIDILHRVNGDDDSSSSSGVNSDNDEENERREDAIAKNKRSIEAMASKSQLKRDKVDMQALLRVHIKKNLEEFRKLLLATVEYLEKQVPCTQHCDCCSSKTKPSAAPPPPPPKTSQATPPKSIKLVLRRK